MLLALLGHVLHHLFLSFLRLLHFFGIHILHHLAHKKGHADHNDKWVGEVAPDIEGSLDLKESISAAGLEDQWVHKSEVLAVLQAKQEGLSVLSSSKFFVINLNDDGLEMIEQVLNFNFVDTRSIDLDIEVALPSDHACVFSSIDCDSA